ncbi:MAG TPA: transporter substrate-binding domain-containing protein [Bordetella sp.]
MRHLKTLAVACAALLSFALAGAAHAQDALARAKAKGVLVIATEEQFPPFDFIKDGKHVGFNVDYFEEVGKKMGLKLEWIDLPWASVLPGLQAKKYDLVAGPASITVERQKVLRFLPPITSVEAMIQIRKGEKGISSLADIAGKKIGAERASYADNEVKKFGATLPNPPTIIEYQDTAQAAADLEAGRLDGVANSSSNVKDSVKRRPDAFDLIPTGFGLKTYSGFMIRKDDDSKTLFDAVSATMLDIKKEGKLTELQKQWLGEAVEVPDAAPELK